jgi:flagellar basal-body rod protein FlgB
MDINDKTFQALSAAINFRQMRQKLISSNIANSETPGYKAKRIDFEKALQGAIDINGDNSLQTSSDRHFSVGGGGFASLSPHIYVDPNDVVSDDGNNVDMEDELIKMDENIMMYNASMELMKKKLGLRKYILSSEK